MEYQLEPTNLHVRAYSKMWLKGCDVCECVNAKEVSVRLEQPPWSKTEYICIDCGCPLREKSLQEVLAEYGDDDDDDK